MSFFLKWLLFISRGNVDPGTLKDGDNNVLLS